MEPLALVNQIQLGRRKAGRLLGSKRILPEQGLVGIRYQCAHLAKHQKPRKGLTGFAALKSSATPGNPEWQQ